MGFNFLKNLISKQSGVQVSNDGHHFTETTQVSLGSNLKNSLSGALAGAFFVLIAFMLLFWNEGSSVARYKALKEGASEVISIPSTQVNSAYEGKLVHMTGHAETKETLKDPLFEVSYSGLKLSRSLQFYVWKEEKKTTQKKNMGGSTTQEVSYDYKPVWSDQWIDSSKFKYPEKHLNPRSLISAEYWQAQNVQFGAFQLSSAQVARISRSEKISVETPTAQIEAKIYPKYREILRKQFPALSLQEIEKKFPKIFPVEKGYYIGANPSKAEVGDVQVMFHGTPNTEISLIYKQAGNSFQPYFTKSVDGDISLLKTGIHDAESMFASAQKENTISTWMFRFAGFFCMFIGFAAMMGPLSALANIIPMLGSLVGLGTSMVALILAIFFSFLTISVSWFFHRPLLSITIIVMGIVIPFALYLRASKKIKLPTQPQPQPQEPPIQESEA